MKLSPSPFVSGEVVVEYTVDKAGVPQNVHVVKPLDAATDNRVVDAVSKVRYTPGTLDGAAVEVPVKLRVAIN